MITLRIFTFYNAFITTDKLLLFDSKHGDKTHNISATRCYSFWSS